MKQLEFDFFKDTNWDELKKRVEKAIQEKFKENSISYQKIELLYDALLDKKNVYISLNNGYKILITLSKYDLSEYFDLDCNIRYISYNMVLQAKGYL